MIKVLATVAALAGSLGLDAVSQPVVQFENWTVDNPEPQNDFDVFANNIVALAGGPFAIVGKRRSDAEGVDSGELFLLRLGVGGPLLLGPVFAGPEPGAQAGHEFEVAGKRLIVSSRFHSVHDMQNVGRVFVSDLTTSALVELGHPDPTQDDEFGNAVGADRGWIAIATDSDDKTSSPRLPSRVYMHKVVGGEPQLEQVLDSPNGLTHEGFGRAIDIEGEWMAISAPGAGVGGEVYMFRHVLGIWVHMETIRPEQVGVVRFGISLDLKRGRLVVGAPGTNDSDGSAHVFRWSGIRWEPVADLHPGPNTASGFGTNVAFGRRFVAVSSPGTSSDLPLDPAGSVSVFQAGGAWDQVALCMASDGKPAELFGNSVAWVGDTLLIGAPSFDDGDCPTGVCNAGKMYGFELDHLHGGS